MVDRIGQKEVLLAINLLYKISMFGSYKRLYAQYNCTEFACRLGKALYEIDSKHPQTLMAHASYRLTKLTQSDPFVDEYTINLT